MVIGHGVMIGAVWFCRFSAFMVQAFDKKRLQVCSRFCGIEQTCLFLTTVIEQRKEQAPL